MLKASAILLVLTAASLSAAGIDINASARGWVCAPANENCPNGNNNGADADNNYLAGATSASDGTNLAQFRNWFEFFVPDSFGQSLVSATLKLDAGGHSGGALTFAVYGLLAQPLVFTDVTTSNAFGSIASSDGSSGTTFNIALNGAALAFFAAKQGGSIFIGGIDSGENDTHPNVTSPGFDTVGDFNSTDSNGSNTVLHLETGVGAAVPRTQLYATSCHLARRARNSHTQAAP